MRIIPAIDIIDGKCVRLTEGDYSTKKVYNEDPLEVAKQFEDAGIEYLHVVDLDGAKSKHIINQKTLERICSKTGLKVDFGGGLKSDEDLRIAVNQVTAGSIAVSNPERIEQWIEKYTSKRIILGADARDKKIATAGWKNLSDVELLPFLASYEAKGMEYVICTDISKDGRLEGPSIDLYKEIMEQTDLKLIASGGVSSMQDLIHLKAIGCEGAIVGKAIYEGKIELNELAELC